MRSMLFMGVWIWDVIGLSPGAVRVIDFENQLHCAQSIIRSTAFDGRAIDYAASKCGYLIVPRRIPVVAGHLFTGVALIVVRVRPHYGQSLIAIALRSGQDSTENQAPPGEVDIEVKSMPPLGCRGIKHPDDALRGSHQGIRVVLHVIDRKSV